MRLENLDVYGSTGTIKIQDKRRHETWEGLHVRVDHAPIVSRPMRRISYMYVMIYR